MLNSTTVCNHVWEEHNNKFICRECGKSKLVFTDGKGVRDNGRPYTKKANKDRFLFPSEYMKFEDVLKSKQKFSVKFLINTGCRIDESKNVIVQDIDLANRRLVFRKTKTKATKGEEEGKPRIIPISTQFAKFLKRYIAIKRLKPQDKLGVLSNNALNTAYKIAAKKAKIKDPQDISSHTFRKTLEVWLMSLGVADIPLTAHLGHDIRTAASHYVSPDIFTWDDRKSMRLIIGDLYERRER